MHDGQWRNISAILLINLSFRCKAPEVGFDIALKSTLPYLSVMYQLSVFVN